MGGGPLNRKWLSFLPCLETSESISCLQRDFQKDYQCQLRQIASFAILKSHYSKTFYRQRSLAEQGDNALGSVHPSVRPLMAEALNTLDW